MAQLHFTTTINRPIEDVFGLLTDLTGYARWLPPSGLYSETQLSDNRIKQGTTYVDQGKSSVMRGVVEVLQAPTDLVFHQTQQQKILGLSNDLDIRIVYHLEAVPDGTRLNRDVTVSVSGLLKLAQPILINAISKENHRILALMKAYLEAPA
jgi:uncharacterized protein YndB with AHSA1/START domain